MKAAPVLLGSVLAVALAVLWWRGYRHADTVSLYLHHGAGQFVVSSRGCVGVLLTDVPAGEAWSWDARTSDNDMMDGAWTEVVDQTNVNRRGWTKFCALNVKDAAGDTRLMGAIVPTWGLLAVTIIPVWFGGRRVLRQRHRAKNNLCLACGYDLRESTGRCPECGEEKNNHEGREETKEATKKKDN